MTSTIAPIDGITNDNHGGYVIVFAITAACVSIISALIRFGHAIRKQLRFGADDAFFILSLVTSSSHYSRPYTNIISGLRPYASTYNRLRRAQWARETYGVIKRRSSRKVLQSISLSTNATSTSPLTM
jgi:hypothetical protein